MENSSIFRQFWKLNRRRVIHVESMSFFTRGFALLSPWNIDGLSMWIFIVEQQRIDEDVSIGLIVYSFRYLRKDWKSSILEPLSVEWKYIRGSNSALLKSKFEENSFVNNWHKYNKLAINWLIYLKQNVFRMNTSFWQYVFLIKSKPEDFNRNNWLYFIS